MNDSWNAHTFGAASEVAREVQNGTAAYPFGLPSGPERARKRDGDGSTRASDYQLQFDGRVIEPARLSVVGRPSIEVRQRGDGATEVVLRRNIASMESLTEEDSAFIQKWGEAVLNQLQAMSRGSYSLALLRRLGHPYGFGAAPGKPLSRSARPVPRRGAGRTLGNVRGMRGAVPTLSVINSQAGRLQRSWQWSMTRDASGFSLSFVNTAPHAWFLAHGTTKMQPHGPFTYAVMGRLSVLDADIGRAIYAVRRRAALDRADAQTVQMLVSAGEQI